MFWITDTVPKSPVITEDKEKDDEGEYKYIDSFMGNIESNGQTFFCVTMKTESFKHIYNMLTNVERVNIFDKTKFDAKKYGVNEHDDTKPEADHLFYIETFTEDKQKLDIFGVSGTHGLGGKGVDIWTQVSDYYKTKFYVQTWWISFFFF